MDRKEPLSKTPPKDRLNKTRTEKSPFQKLEKDLLPIKNRVNLLQIYPFEYPKPSVKELEQRIKVVPLPGGKGHYWDMDPGLIQELYPAGWLHKAEVCKSAASGNQQYVIILGAQTAKRDFLEPAKWVSDHLEEKERNVMKNNLTIHCVDILGPPRDPDVWQQTQQNGQLITTLNSEFATGIYETTSIEDFLSRLIDNPDYKKLFEGKDLHFIAEGSTDYLSEETLKQLLTFVSSGEVKSLTLRTIIPNYSAQYVTPETAQVINDSLKRDLGIEIEGAESSVDPADNPLPAKDIEGIVQNVWKTNYSDEQRRQKGLDSSYPGNHLRPQDLISAFRLLGKRVIYNLFSTIGGNPNGTSIVIS